MINSVVVIVGLAFLVCCMLIMDTDAQSLPGRGELARHWIAGEWAPCSRSCGGGYSLRSVHCVEERDDGTFRKTLDTFCPEESKQTTNRTCNEFECPQWFAGQWSPCSKTCGSGFQLRGVVCRQTVQNDCEEAERPVDRRVCHTDIPCIGENGGKSDKANSHANNAAHDGGNYREGSELFPFYDVMDREPLREGEGQQASSDYDDRGFETAESSALSGLPKWRVGEWSECSVTCGRGFRTRERICERQIFKTDVSVTDETFCTKHMVQPVAQQPCQLPACSAAAIVPLQTPSPTTKLTRHSIFFMQLAAKEKLSLRINVQASRAVLILGSTVFIHCTGTNNVKSNVVWMKDGLVVERRGRVKITESGVLRIRNSRNTDAGEYACINGNAPGKVHISFQSADEAALANSQRKEFRLNLTTVKPNQSDLERGTGEETESDSDAIYVDFDRIALLLEDRLIRGHYFAGSWSSCSKTCGGRGTQTRNISCEIVRADYSLVVSDDFCSGGGTGRLVAQKECGVMECPRWIAGPWTECTSKRCESIGVGSRSRNVECINGSTGLPQIESMCDESLKPSVSEPCSHQQCQVAWNTSSWSTCSVSCGGKGQKTRRLQCAWVFNGSEASSEICRSLPNRPETTRPCYDLLPCEQKDGCRDESRYCHMIVSMKMCHQTQYRRQCCHSCRRLDRLHVAKIKRV